MTSELSEIRHVRKRLGLSQVALARLANVSQSLIAKVEAGRIDPSYSKARKIIDALQSIRGEKEMKASDIMNRRIITISPSETIQESVRKMKKFDISQIPVMEGDRVIGLVSDSILLESLSSSKDPAMKVRGVMKDPPPIISKNSSTSIVVDILKFFPIVIVVNEEGKMVGIISKSDVLTNAYRRGLPK